VPAVAGLTRAVCVLGFHPILRMSSQQDPFAIASARSFVLIVGNARSGSTMLGSVLDGHPKAVVANETAGSANLWRTMSGPQILHEVRDNAVQAARSGRASEGYRYQIGPSPDAKGEVWLAGDKAWNPALLMLHGKPDLLPSLEDRLQMPVRLVHAIRNPFDTIATMHRRSGASIEDRTRWYFMHCEAAAALRDRLPATHFLNSHHADLLADPAAELHRLCDFLGLPVVEEHRAAVARVLFERPRRTAALVPWTAAQRRAIVTRMAEFEFLDRYRTELPREPDHNA
jgi:hypothetical protein